MINYEIICVEIASLYNKQRKQEKASIVASSLFNIFGGVLFIVFYCNWCRIHCAIFDVNIRRI